MHIPEKTLTLDKKPYQQRRIAIQGFSGTGKTTAAITAKNPIVLDFDNSVDDANCKAAGLELSGVSVVPFYDAEFIGRTNARDVFEKWLEINVPKFTTEQTLILDSWTRLQDEFDRQTEKEPVISKRGEVDEFAFWERKQTYARNILTTLRSARCDVIVIFHETVETDDKGRITGKVNPMMQGKFVHKLPNYFTDWFRQIAITKESTDKLASDLGITKSLLDSYCASCTDGTLRLWQTQTSSIAQCKTKLIGVPRFILPNMKIFYAA